MKNQGAKPRHDPLVADNVMIANTAEYGAGLRFCFFNGPLPEPLVTGNLMLYNTASFAGGGLNAEDAWPILYQTTIEGNYAQTAGGGVYSHNNGSITLVNSIIANSTHGGGLYAETGASIVTSYCDVWNNSGGDYIGCTPSVTDLDCDPEYCAEHEFDVRLYETSCCQGAGENGNDIGARGVGCFTVPNVVFYDNFSDQDDDGWVVEVAGDGTLQVAAGEYAGAATADGSWARSTVAVSAVQPADYQYWVKLQREGTADPDGWSDFYLRFADPAHYYKVRLDGELGQLWRYYEFGLELLTEFPCTIAAGEQVTLRFVAYDILLQGFLTSATGVEVPLFHYVDSTLPILSGTVGVGVTADGPVRSRFDDVMVALADSTISAVIRDARGAPPSGAELALRAWPNPFNPVTTISYRLPAAGRLTLEIFNLRGERVRVLLDEDVTAGDGAAIWDGTSAGGEPMPSGVYFYRARAHGSRRTGKLMLMK